MRGAIQACVPAAADGLHGRGHRPLSLLHRIVERHGEDLAAQQSPRDAMAEIDRGQCGRGRRGCLGRPQRHRRLDGRGIPDDEIEGRPVGQSAFQGPQLLAQAGVGPVDRKDLDTAEPERAAFRPASSGPTHPDSTGPDSRIARCRTVPPGWSVARCRPSTAPISCQSTPIRAASAGPNMAYEKPPILEGVEIGTPVRHMNHTGG
ncbi:hypothetical protein [Rhodobacter sp. CZR27]|uniref:hypothetical protein n=1 Tax=Rhodobacter sp. CZR27 TaxID=2033869 RepID=UPI000BBE1219|nr:hypothetical protein [Rhodobacter sp. CZR27]